MDPIQRQALTRALAGNGMLGQAGDATKDRAEYDMMIADGVDLPPFPEWFRAKQMQSMQQGQQQLVPGEHVMLNQGI